MFGVGPQELIIIGLICLIVFGPSKLTSMARDLGRFASEARRSVDEFKDEIMSEEVNEAREDLREARRSARRTVNEFKSEVNLGEDRGDRSYRASRDAHKPPREASLKEEQNDEKENEGRRSL